MTNPLRNAKNRTVRHRSLGSKGQCHQTSRLQQLPTSAECSVLTAAASGISTGLTVARFKIMYGAAKNTWA